MSRSVVLVTGTSGTGKSSAPAELARRGHRVLDTDGPGWITQQVEDWDDLIHASRGVSNVDDLTLVIRLLAAGAMENKGVDEAALEIYKDTLRSKKRDAELLKEARYQRAELYLKLGKSSMAKGDFSRIYAEDPEFKAVAELIA